LDKADNERATDNPIKGTPIRPDETEKNPHEQVKRKFIGQRPVNGLYPGVISKRDEVAKMRRDLAKIKVHLTAIKARQFAG
jgi:hypothetical protein